MAEKEAINDKVEKEVTIDEVVSAELSKLDNSEKAKYVNIKDDEITGIVLKGDDTQGKIQVTQINSDISKDINEEQIKNEDIKDDRVRGEKLKGDTLLFGEVNEGEAIVVSAMTANVDGSTKKTLTEDSPLQPHDEGSTIGVFYENMGLIS